MKKLALLFMFLFFLACTKNDERIEFTVMQINDVYEIDALEGGTVGGLARVEAIHQELLKENPNTILVHGGDFLNPSLIGTLRDENGERFNGKQMVDVMNAMNFDLVVPGNHEFDLKYKDLQKRLNESNFQWIMTNPKLINDSLGTIPFYKKVNGKKINYPRTVIFDFKNKKGTTIKVGFFGATIDSNPKEYIDYGDVYEDAINAYNTLEPNVNIVLGLTHLSLSQDKLLAKTLPEVPMIFGGHEHTNMLVPEGETLISKADANAKTAYIHRFSYNINTKETKIKSELVTIDESVLENKKVANVIQKWNVLLDGNLKKVLDNPYEVVYEAIEPLDGRDTQIRSKQTNLGKIITAAMSKYFNDEVDGAFLNGGSIRIDDELHGAITGVDIFRVMPFGGGINKIEIKGDLLKRTLKYGRLKAGTGAYLQHYNIEYSIEDEEWYIGGKLINDNKIYSIVVSDYLLLGLDIPFLKSDVEGVFKVYANKPEDIASDIRKVVIEFLKEL